MRLGFVLRFLTLALFIWCVVTEAAVANTWPPAAIVLLQIPIVVGFISYGTGLLGIALLEGFILSKREKLNLGKSIAVSGLANSCSLLLGILMTMGLAALPYGVLGISSLGILYTLLIFFSWSSVPYFQLQNLNLHSKLRPVIRLAIWSIIWFVAIVGSFQLIFIVNQLNPSTVGGVRFPDPNVSFLVNGLQLLTVILFLAIGFSTSVVSEAFCLIRLLPQPSTTVWRTALIMNLRSYAYIAVPITLAFLISRLPSWS